MPTLKQWKKLSKRSNARHKAKIQEVRIVKSFHGGTNFGYLKQVPILPLKHRCKLYYYSTNTVTFTTGAANAQVFSANGLFDPDITGVGHQPMGFDQLMALYEHYTVTKCKIRATLVNEAKTDTCTVGISINPDATVETVPGKLIENGLNKRKWLNWGFAGDDKMETEMMMTVDISKINGRPKPIVGDDLFRGDSASNPSEQTYLHVFGFNDASAASVTIRFHVVLEYDAVFTEPRKLAQS